MPANFVLACADCGHTFSTFSSQPGCPACRSEWLEARYDYAALGPGFQARLAQRGRDLWRYHELLPIRLAENIVSLGEGGTPLVHTPNLGLMLGRPNLFVKDERQSPTGSFKDRKATVAISAMKEAGVKQLVVASTGNVAISYAAYCARAGIQLYAFLTSLVPPEKMRECALYGAQVVKVTGTYDRCKEIAAQFAQQRSLPYDKGMRNVGAIEAMKTIAYESAEQLAPLFAGGNGQGGALWRAPDWYIQSVSGGLGPVGVMKGFRELKQMGLIDRVPQVACIQSDGCAPMANAFRLGRPEAEIVPVPRTRIHTVATGNPGRSYKILKGLIDAHGGLIESVSDDEAYRAINVMAKMEGLSMEPAAALAFAGLFKLVRAGRIAPNDVVLINCTGHTFPVEEVTLGENWARELGEAAPAEAAPAAPTPQEGLLAALDQLDERVRTIAIVDDNPDAARLIRRILQAKGTYQIHEAYSGRDGLNLIQSAHPDLVVLDLMMPEMDGFAVLDALRANEATQDIPVIVVTAKELTPAERERLGSQIESLLQKGSFMDDQLLDDIIGALT